MTAKLLFPLKRLPQTASAASSPSPAKSIAARSRATWSSKVRAQLESLGFEISDADWNALPREQADDSYYSSPDTDPGEGVKPLPALPEKSDDFEFAYAYEDSGYGSYSEALIVEATCNYCGQTMCIESIENPENHDRDCEYFQTEEEKSEEEAK